jgi:membrane-associated phospholipid phosphatase
MENRTHLNSLKIQLIAAVLVLFSSASFASDVKSKSAPTWVEASLILGTTAGLYVVDEDIQQWVQENRGSTTDEIARYAKPFGDYKLVAPSLLAALAYGHFGKREGIKNTAVMGIKSFLITGIITQTLKYTGHRHRPSSGDPFDTWDGPSFLGGNDSFPSGHASTAFSVLTVVALEYKDYPVVSPLAYGIASLTALSRINDNNHWASDAFFGSAIGYFTARAVVGSHEKDGKIAFYPVIHDDGGLLVLAYKL